MGRAITVLATTGVIVLMFVFLPVALAAILSVVAALLVAHGYPIVYPERKDVVQASRTGSGLSVVVLLSVLAVVSVSIYVWIGTR